MMASDDSVSTSDGDGDYVPSRQELHSAFEDSTVRSLGQSLALHEKIEKRSKPKQTSTLNAQAENRPEDTVIDLLKALVLDPKKGKLCIACYTTQSRVERHEDRHHATLLPSLREQRLKAEELRKSSSTWSGIKLLKECPGLRLTTAGLQQLKKHLLQFGLFLIDEEATDLVISVTEDKQKATYLPTVPRHSPTHLVTDQIISDQVASPRPSHADSYDFDGATVIQGFLPHAPVQLGHVKPKLILPRNEVLENIREAGLHHQFPIDDQLFVCYVNFMLADSNKASDIDGEYSQSVKQNVAKVSKFLFFCFNGTRIKDVSDFKTAIPRVVQYVEAYSLANPNWDSLRQIFTHVGTFLHSSLSSIAESRKNDYMSFQNEVKKYGRLVRKRAELQKSLGQKAKKLYSTYGKALQFLHSESYCSYIEHLRKKNNIDETDYEMLLSCLITRIVFKNHARGEVAYKMRNNPLIYNHTEDGVTYQVFNIPGAKNRKVAKIVMDPEDYDLFQFYLEVKSQIVKRPHPIYLFCNCKGMQLSAHIGDRAKLVQRICGVPTDQQVGILTVRNLCATQSMKKYMDLMDKLGSGSVETGATLANHSDKTRRANYCKLGEVLAAVRCFKHLRQVEMTNESPLDSTNIPTITELVTIAKTAVEEDGVIKTSSDLITFSTAEELTNFFSGSELSDFAQAHAPSKWFEAKGRYGSLDEVRNFFVDALRSVANCTEVHVIETVVSRLYNHFLNKKKKAQIRFLFSHLSTDELLAMKKQKIGIKVKTYVSQCWKLATDGEENDAENELKDWHMQTTLSGPHLTKHIQQMNVLLHNFGAEIKTPQDVHFNAAINELVKQRTVTEPQTEDDNGEESEEEGMDVDVLPVIETDEEDVEGHDDEGEDSREIDFQMEQDEEIEAESMEIPSFNAHGLRVLSKENDTENASEPLKDWRYQSPTPGYLLPLTPQSVATSHKKYLVWSDGIVYPNFVRSHIRGLEQWWEKRLENSTVEDEEEFLRGYDLRKTTKLVLPKELYEIVVERKTNREQEQERRKQLILSRRTPTPEPEYNNSYEEDVDEIVSGLLTDIAKKSSTEKTTVTAQETVKVQTTTISELNEKQIEQQMKPTSSTQDVNYETSSEVDKEPVKKKLGEQQIEQQQKKPTSQLPTINYDLSSESDEEPINRSKQSWYAKAINYELSSESSESDQNQSKEANKWYRKPLTMNCLLRVMKKRLRNNRKASVPTRYGPNLRPFVHLTHRDESTYEVSGPKKRNRTEFASTPRNENFNKLVVAVPDPKRKKPISNETVLHMRPYSKHLRQTLTDRLMCSSRPFEYPTVAYSVKAKVDSTISVVMDETSGFRCLSLFLLGYATHYNLIKQSLRGYLKQKRKAWLEKQGAKDFASDSSFEFRSGQLPSFVWQLAAELFMVKISISEPDAFGRGFSWRTYEDPVDLGPKSSLILRKCECYEIVKSMTEPQKTKEPVDMFSSLREDSDSDDNTSEGFDDITDDATVWKKGAPNEFVIVGPVNELALKVYTAKLSPLSSNRSAVVFKNNIEKADCCKPKSFELVTKDKNSSFRCLTKVFARNEEAHMQLRRLLVQELKNKHKKFFETVLGERMKSEKYLNQRQIASTGEMGDVEFLIAAQYFKTHIQVWSGTWKFYNPDFEAEGQLPFVDVTLGDGRPHVALARRQGAFAVVTALEQSYETTQHGDEQEPAAAQEAEMQSFKYDPKEAAEFFSNSSRGNQQYIPWIEVRETPGIGLGLYAKTHIPNNVYVLDYQPTEAVMSFDEHNEDLDRKHPDQVAKICAYVLYDKKRDWVYRAHHQQNKHGLIVLGRIANHTSCSKCINMKVKNYENQVLFKTTRDIQPGAQLLWDYGKNAGGGRYGQDATGWSCPCIQDNVQNGCTKCLKKRSN